MNVNVNGLIVCCLQTYISSFVQKYIVYENRELICHVMPWTIIPFCVSPLLSSVAEEY